MTDQDPQARRHLQVTNSEMGTFRSCRQKWWFTYHERLRSKRTARPLAVGSAIHAGIGHVYRHIMAVQTGGPISDVAIDVGLSRGDAPTVDALTALAVEHLHRGLSEYLTELWDALPRAPHVDAVDRIMEESELAEREAVSAVVRFVEHFAVDDFNRYLVVAVEQPFHVPLVDASGYRRHLMGYSGVWDGVKFDPQVGDFILDEHKSTSGDALDAERKLDMDPQTTGYIYALGEALRRIGPKKSQLPPHEALAWALRQVQSRGGIRGSRDREPRVGRVFYNVVRKKGPGEPSVNKDGTVSTGACDTTRDTYLRALVEQRARIGAMPGGVPEWLAKARDACALKGTAANLERVRKSEERWVELQAKQELRADACASPSRYCMRHEVFHGSDLVERFRSETFADAAVLRRAVRGDHPITRNPEHCNPQGSFGCALRSICIEDTPEGRAEFNVRADVHGEVTEAEAEAEVEAAAAESEARRS